MSVESKVTTAKGKEKVGQPMAGFDAGHSSSDESLDEEFGIPRLSTLGVKMMQGGEGIRKSTRVKYPVERLRYDNLVSHHYAYMMNVIQEQEPTSFKDAVGKPEWEGAMDEEMENLNGMELWMKK